MHIAEENAIGKEPNNAETCDPFVISEDGHYINVQDGYVVPRDFPEFYERYPAYVREFVRSRMAGRPFADMEDRESELLLFLMTLPPGSKFREPGYNGRPNGCTDRIQVFSPSRSHGCGFPRFRSWLNLCLGNRMLSLDEKLNGNPVCRRSTRIIASSPASPAEADEGWVMQRHYRLFGCPNPADDMDNKLFQDEFEKFVAGHSEELSAFCSVLREARTFTAVRKILNLTEQQVYHMRSRLIALATAFANGEPICYQPQASGRALAMAA